MASTQVDRANTLLRYGGRAAEGGSISQVGFSGIGPSTGAAQTASMPSGIENGDHEFAFIAVKESGKMAALSTPWVSLFTPIVVSTSTFYGYRRPLTTSSTGLPFQGQDATGTNINTADYTMSGIVLRGVDATRPLETDPEAFGDSNIVHWGRSARTGANPAGDFTTVPNCWQLFVFMHASGSRTLEWAPDITQIQSRTNATGPQIIIAKRFVRNADHAGGRHIGAGSSTVGAMIQFCVRPATP